MVWIAWLLDIGGFVLFLFTDDMTMWMASLGMIAAAFMIAQVGISNPSDPDLNGDGVIDQQEAVAFLKKVTSLNSVRSSAVGSAIVIGVFMAISMAG